MVFDDHFLRERQVFDFVLSQSLTTVFLSPNHHDTQTFEGGYQPSSSVSSNLHSRIASEPRYTEAPMVPAVPRDLIFLVRYACISNSD